MPFGTLGFAGGWRTMADPTSLESDELQIATGIRYKPGDRDCAWKVNGRTAFGDTGTAAAVKGVAIAQFDDSNGDRVLALSGTALYTAPIATGVFSSLVTGLSSSATNLTAAHSNDRWYVGNGVDRNRVIESDGTVLLHGMESPVVEPTAAASLSVGAAEYPTTSTNGSPGFTSPEKAYDGDTTTYAWASRWTAGSNVCTWRAWASSTQASRTLWVGMTFMTTASPNPVSRYIPSSLDASWTVELSTDDGVSYSTINQGKISGAKESIGTSIAISDAVNSNLLRVRVTLTYTSGTKQATLTVDTIKVSGFGATGSFSTVDGIYYGLTEVDAAREWESPPIYSKLVTLSSQNKIVLTLPSAAINSNSTHWRIYRTTDGGTYPAGLGRVAQALITETTWTDNFDIDVNTQARPLVRLASVLYNPGEEQAVETQYYPLDEAPPAFHTIVAYRGRLLGLTDEAPRSVRYTPIEEPNSWPAIYVVEKLPVSQHDVLVGIADLGDLALAFGEQVVFKITDFPEVTQGILNDASVSVLAGQPGCVGRRAYCTYSTSGEIHAAWVSPFGVYETNGIAARRLTTDLDWKATVRQANLGTAVLRYDPHYQCLVVAYDGTGAGYNNRWMIVHLSTDHQNGRALPKITGPQYGEIGDMAVGLVDAGRVIYSAHPSDGKVYTEDSGGTDASESYDGTDLPDGLSYAATSVPMIVKTGKKYGEGGLVQVSRATLRHTDWGSDTVTVDWLAGRDNAQGNQTTRSTVSVSGIQGHDLFVGLAGDWHEVTVTHTGSAPDNPGTGVGTPDMGPSLLPMRVDWRRMGKSGKVATF